MSVILTAMNRFINEADGSQTAFLDGNQPDRLCQPMVDHITAGSGQVHTGKPICSIEVVKNSNNISSSDPPVIESLKLSDGSRVKADYYVSAMPVDVVKKLIPKEWSTMPYFAQLNELEGIPVINIQIWFDKKLKKSVDGLCFSRSPLLSVYADMSTCCDEYASSDASMLELVFAPCTPAVGADRNWIAATDEEIVNATLSELERLFPLEIGPGAGNDAAKVVKSTVVRVPKSVYAATPGRNKFRPSQQTPIENFIMAGDFANQKYLGSMEGAVLSGKLAAKVVCDLAAAGRDPNISSISSSAFGGGGVRPIHDSITKKQLSEKEPIGIKGNHPIAFGGGQQGTGQVVKHP
eukprot:scaffold293_cov135-Cylindrotheca_fusiformis.AAC.7